MKIEEVSEFVRKYSKGKEQFNSCIYYLKGEWHIFFYGNNDYSLLKKALEEQVSDPELNFTFYDSAILSQKARLRIRKETAKSSYLDDLQS